MQRQKKRTAPVQRKSNETQIEGSINIDGIGKTKIKTPIGFLSHMLELFAFHGYFDLDLCVSGDTHIDIHHTNEDIGIALGKAFKQALGDKLGIKRFGYAYAPMEDTFGLCVIDISGRGHYKFNLGKMASYNDVVIFNGNSTDENQIRASLSEFGSDPVANVNEIKKPIRDNSASNYKFDYFDHFMDSFAKQLGATLTFTLYNPSSDLHTNLETMFKSLGLALDQATTIDPRRQRKVPSTKGIID